MKKLFLSVIATIACQAAFCQMSIFMKIIENKMLCNKEDQFTYFMQANNYERQNENHYVYHYYSGKDMYFVDIINENECYATYRTDNVKDYNRIKTAIAGKCAREYSGDKSLSYVCNTRRVQDVQIIFEGFSTEQQAYEIKIYQNPNAHEVPYSQSDRTEAGYDK
jgi:hypothetical protein